MAFPYAFSLMFPDFRFRAGRHCHPVAAARPLSRSGRDSQEQKQNLFHAAGSAALPGSFNDFDPLA